MTKSETQLTLQVRELLEVFDGNPTDVNFVAKEVEALFQQALTSLKDKECAGDTPTAPKTGYTFTTKQLIAWSKEQEMFANPAWIETKEGQEGYKMAMRHLRHYVKHPIREII